MTLGAKTHPVAIGVEHAEIPYAIVVVAGRALGFGVFRGDSAVVFVHLVAKEINRARAGKSPLRLPLHWRPGPQGRWLNERLQEIIHLHRLAEGDSPEAKLARLAASTALQSLLSAVAVGSCPTASATLTVTRVDGVLEQVRRQLDEPYRESLEVPALARHAGVSQKHLSRKFRARHGMTLQSHGPGRRIELARHLLTTTRLPLKAVGIEAGLGNLQYFYRQFVAATGHRPCRERAGPARTGR